ncbi:MAG: ATPase, T2SS/T4P/T4SS family [Candidatus Babeliales bacterium]
MLKDKIGDILVELKVISPEQLQECLYEQKGTGKSLSHILLERHFVTKIDLARALAKQVSLPFVDRVTEQMVDLAMLGKVPLKFLRQHIVIPIMFEGQKTIVTANPRDLEPLDNLSLLMAGEVSYAVATDEVINDAINRYYPLETSKEMMEELKEEDGGGFGLEEGGDIDEKDIMEMVNDAPIVRLVNHILLQAVKENASDIHIESFEKELRIRYRIDGNMYQRVIPPKRYQGAIVSRIKIMANLNIAEKRVPQDGRIQIKIADKAVDLRVSVLPCSFGERVSIRLLDKGKNVFELDKINFSPRDLGIVTKNIQRPNGIILVSGPTGSGKTTTLYSILTRLNQPDVNIITVEDSVEYTINGISQVQVNEKAGMTFAAALRSIVRQDPDIILIGEMRDGITAQIATQAALTGHLVLSTIHTISAPATITRLIDMGVEPFLIASTLNTVISQRLVRRLCDKCKQVYQPGEALLKRAELSPEVVKKTTFYKPVGCDECLNTGYRGRTPIFEVMEVNDGIAKLIVQRVDATVIKQKAIADGMTLLVDDGLRCVAEGITTLEEVMSVAFVESVE